jgi:hypothetical protein
MVRSGAHPGAHPGAYPDGKTPGYAKKIAYPAGKTPGYAYPGERITAYAPSHRAGIRSKRAALPPVCPVSR